MAVEIKLKFNGRDLAERRDAVITSGSVETVTAAFEFDAAWDGFAKTAIFASGDTVKCVMLDDTGVCTVPWEVLTDARQLTVGVVGMDGDRVMPSVRVPVFVAEGIYTSGTAPEAPTPDVYEQLVALAQQTQSIAQSVRADADAGKFDGAKGEKGDTGDKGDPGAQGEKGDKGEKGDTGEKGDQGEKGDKGDKGDQGEKGDKGDKGDAFVYSDFTLEQLDALKVKGDGATVAIGTVTAGETGTSASVENVGTPTDAVLNFVLPKGDKGDKGDKGAKGDKGDTGEKGDKGETGATGPQGEKGDKGDTGAHGEKGDKGDKGDKGEKGDPGSDASVTADNIVSALGYTPANASVVAQNTSARHTHSNKTVLDNITADKITEWDEKAGKQYVEGAAASLKQEIYGGEGTFEGVITFNGDQVVFTGNVEVPTPDFDNNPATKKYVDDATANEHTHSNKTVLDGITDDKVSQWDSGQSNVIETIKVNGTAQTPSDKAVNITVPTKTSQLSNDSGFITSSDIPEGSAASTTTPKMDGTASVGTEMAFARGDHVHPSDTTKVDKVSGKGLSTNDFTDTYKTKLDGIETGANKTVVDSEISNTSTNPVQNKVIKNYVDGAIPTSIKNPYPLTITIGDTTVTYDGSEAKSIEIADGSEVAY